jgi:hypothetical protein
VIAQAIEAGGDTDTIASITGQIAGTLAGPPTDYSEQFSRIIGAVPLMAVSGIYVAWRNRTNLAVAAAVVLACYVPFVFYWNLRA